MQKIASKGRMVGEQHHNAVLSDHEVELVRTMYDETTLGVRTWSYGRLAITFGVSKASIRDIVKFRRRAYAAANDV